MCYTNCNSTYRYSYNGSCWNTCPAGTYLTYTNVLCSACAAVCLTCTVSPTQCTSCSASYYFNLTCLTICPSGYFGNATTLTCVSCSTVPANTCSQPLTYTTSYSVENYQSVVTLQFNQNVSLATQLQDILKIKLQARRLLYEKRLDHLEMMKEKTLENQMNHDRTEEQRMLQVGTLVNNGVPYTY